MEYVIVILLVIILFLGIFILVQGLKNKRSDIYIGEKVGEFEKSFIKEIGNFKYEFSGHLTKNFEELNDRIVRYYSEKAQHRENSNKTKSTINVTDGKDYEDNNIQEYDD